jgi:hypothetical protein
MTEQNAIAVLGAEQPTPTVRTEEELKVMMAAALRFAQSGLLPKGIDTPQKVLTIMFKARELGIPPSYALSNIAVIGGKPATGAELLLALVYRAYGGNAIRVVVSTRERCVVRYRRPEWPDASEEEWTIQDAKDAGLTVSDAWKKYPKTMLRWRAISAACKLGFPEVIGGLYTPEELGARVEIDERGEEVIDSFTESQIEARPEGRVLSSEPPVAQEASFENVWDTPDPWDEPGSDPEAWAGDAEPLPQELPIEEFDRATDRQMESIAKLRRLLGETDDAGDLSKDEATAMISELSHRYNARKSDAAARAR